MSKILTSIRLTPKAKRLLELIAKNLGISQTAVIEVLLRDEAERRGIVYEEEKE